MTHSSKSIGLVGALLLGLLSGGCRSPQRPQTAMVSVDHRPVEGVPIAEKHDVKLAELASTNPQAFLVTCLDHYTRLVSGYHCGLIRQEQVNGELRPEQEFEVIFIEAPFSVELRWVRGPKSAKRVVYAEPVPNTGQTKKARVELSGVPIPLNLDIHGSVMKGHSRRPLDQFGFRRILEGIVAVCEAWKSKPGYSLVSHGVDMAHGRPCYLIERRLPESAKAQTGLAVLLRIWIDQQWLVPIHLEEFADSEGMILLGRYEFHDVAFDTLPAIGSD